MARRAGRREPASVSDRARRETLMATTSSTAERAARLAETTAIARVGSGDGQVALPEKIRRAAGIADGDTLYLEVLAEGEAGFRGAGAHD